MAPPDETTRQRIVSERLKVLGASKESSEYIVRRATDVVNATPAALLDLSDRLSALLAGRGASGSGSSPPVTDTVTDTVPPARPAVTARQKPLDDAVAEARRRVVDGKDSMEACAARWIDRNRRDGSLMWWSPIFDFRAIRYNNCMFKVVRPHRRRPSP